MKRPQLDLYDSWLSIAIAFISAILITAFLTHLPLVELKQWKWDAILGHLVGVVLVVMFGASLSFGIAEHLMKDEHGDPIKRSRVAAYTVCLLVLLAFSAGLGMMWSSGAEPGDEMEGTGQVATKYVPPKSLAERDALIQKIFLAFLAPSLLGVRAALGPKAK